MSGNFQFGVVFLAAGRSTRMGRPKLLLPWKSTSVLGHLLTVWGELGAAQMAVVAAADDEPIRAELERLRRSARNLIANANPESGMFSSVRCAAAWPGWGPRLTHIVMALGDQPHLKVDTLKLLLKFAAANPARICQPSHRGHPRHPVIFPHALLPDLASAPGPTLKDYLRQFPIALCACDDEGLDLDLDHPQDYLRALEHLG